MMDEKTMVSDTLTGINGELKMYAEYISQSEDPKLKQTLKQMRNKAEAAQEQIYQIAREKSYYVPAVDIRSVSLSYSNSGYRLFCRIRLH